MAKKKISNKQKLIALKKANLENAREFVQKNFDAISKGKIDYKSLDTTAKFLMPRRTLKIPLPTKINL